jgi:transposase
LDRNQAHLFSPTLDAMIPQDHPVRLFDEILSQSDWLPWEARYPHGAGRPPIRPKVMASVILYGLSAGVRSSRRLEEACIVRTDFMWLTEGRQIDHSTICDFRTMFGKELKDTLRQVGRMAITLGLMRLNPNRARWHAAAGRSRGSARDKPCPPSEVSGTLAWRQSTRRQPKIKQKRFLTSFSPV